MSDPNTPAITEATPETRTLSLSDIGQRHLRTIQRIFDTTAYLAEGARLVSERGYDEMVKAVRFLPAQKEHRHFDAAREEAGRYLLRSVLGDAMTVVVPLLEDLRAFSGLAAWQKTEARDPERLKVILGTERSDFLKLDLEGKIAHLRDVCGISSVYASAILSIAKLAACVGSRGGVVGEKDTTSGGELTVRLATIEVSPEPNAAPKLGELRKTFAIGDKVTLDKTELLNVLMTVSLFISSMLTATQNRLRSEAA